MAGEVYQWVPGIVAVATVIANAAITHSAVSRHEKAIEANERDINELKTQVAVLKSKLKGGGDIDG
jgi:hypothetical protein